MTDVKDEILAILETELEARRREIIKRLSAAMILVSDSEIDILEEVISIEIAAFYGEIAAFYRGINEDPNAVLTYLETILVGIPGRLIVTHDWINKTDCGADALPMSIEISFTMRRSFIMLDGKYSADVAPGYQKRQ